MVLSTAILCLEMGQIYIFFVVLQNESENIYPDGATFLLRGL